MEDIAGGDEAEVARAYREFGQPEREEQEYVAGVHGF